MKLYPILTFLLICSIVISISSSKLKLSKRNDTRWKLLDTVISKAMETNLNLKLTNMNELEAVIIDSGLEDAEDVFSIKKAFHSKDFKKHPVVISGLLLLKNFNLLADSNLLKKASVLAKIESLYLDVPYHNKYHPADMLLRLNRWLKNDKFKNIKSIEKEEVKIVLESLVYAVAGHDAYHPGVKNSEVCRPSVQERMKNDLKGAANNICYKLPDPSENSKLTLEMVHSYLTNSILALEKDNLPKEIVDSSKKALESISQRKHFFEDLNFAKNSEVQLEKLMELELVDSCITATDYMVSLNLKNNDKEMEKLAKYDWSKHEDKDFIKNLKQLARYLVITLDISNTGSNHVKRSIRLSLGVLSEFSFGSNKSFNACEIISEQKLGFFYDYFEKISKVLHLSEEENLLKNVQLNNYFLFRKFEQSDSNSINDCKDELNKHFTNLKLDKIEFNDKMKLIPEASIYIKKMEKDRDFMLSNRFDKANEKK